MNATPADQLRLLDLADLDTRIGRAENARKNPPQASRIQQLIAQRQQLSHELTGHLGTRDDLRSEISRIEADVEVVDARRARDAERLAASSNTKEIQGFESELQALARRKSDLEDAELEVMDRLEQTEATIAGIEAQIAETNAEGAELSAEAKRLVAEASSTIEAAQRDRTAVAASVAPELVALYNRLAQRSAGAARLVRRACEGCHMVLSGTDLESLRAASDDTVITCPECGCILVRTEDSGL